MGLFLEKRDAFQEREKNSRAALGQVLSEAINDPEALLEGVNDRNGLKSAIRKIGLFSRETGKPSFEPEIEKVSAEEMLVLVDRFFDPETRRKTLPFLPKNYGFDEAIFRVLDREQRERVKNTPTFKVLQELLPTLGPIRNKEGRWYSVSDLRQMFERFSQDGRYERITAAAGLRTRVRELSTIPQKDDGKNQRGTLAGKINALEGNSESMIDTV